MTAEPVHYTPSTMGPRGKPMSHARRALRKQHVLTAATQVFVSRGFHAATMDEIAHVAGCSKPILYRQFSGKLELYLAVLQEHIDSLTHAVERALDSTAANRDRVHAAVAAYFDFVDHETQGFRLVFDTTLTNEPAVQWRVERASDACVNAVTTAVTKDGALDPAQAHLLASGLVGASQFAARYWLDTGRRIPKDEAVAAIAALCWGGLARIPLHPAPDHDV